MIMRSTPRADRDFLRDVLRRGQVLEELREEDLHREALAKRLDVSSATSYRYTNWLSDQGMLTDSDEEVALTPLGETIAAEVVTFNGAIRRSLESDDGERDILVEVTNLAPGLQALLQRPLDRRDLEERLGVSKTTGYRLTRSLEDRGLVERLTGRYALTPEGSSVLEAVSEFETNVRLAVQLGPVLPVLRDAASVGLDAFADATVTTIQGYVHSPQSRFLELLAETETLRGLTVSDIAPFYLGEIQRRIEHGLELEHIMRPEFAAQQLAEYPDRAIEVCDSDNVTVYLHADLWYSLAIFDDRIGIGVRDPDTSALKAFVDTGSREARAWAEDVYVAYRAKATPMPRFDAISLKETIETGLLTEPDRVEGR